MKNFVANKEVKLSKFLKERYGAEMPYSTYQKLLRNKDIKINGKRVNSDVLLKVDDIVEVYYDGAKKPLTVVFEDKNVLVLDKPSGITSEDLEVLVKKEFETATLCHRLDRNTSGLLLFSLNSDAETELLKAFKDRTISKYYLAEVYGSLKSNSGRLEDYLVKNESASEVKVYNKKVDGSVKIITEYQALEKTEDTTLVEVNLITGKTHQIRAHFAFYGNFIIGDGKYGDNLINRDKGAKYQRLTAYKVVFNFGGGKLSYLNNKEIKLDRKPW